MGFNTGRWFCQCLGSKSDPKQNNTIQEFTDTMSIRYNNLFAQKSRKQRLERLYILSNSTRFARSKLSGSEVLNEKKLSIPVNLLRARRKTSEILTNQKEALYVERIFSHSICSEQILNLVKLSEDSFPDLNTVYNKRSGSRLNQTCCRCFSFWQCWTRIIWDWLVCT